MKLKPQQKYVIFKKLRLDIIILCEINKVSRSGYYKWLRKSKLPDKDLRDYELIKEIFEKGKKKLGWRSVKMMLNSNYGVVINHKKIVRIMNKYQLFVKIRRRNPYKDIMKKNQEHRTFANVLNRGFKQNVPRKVLCTDITYLYYGLGRKGYLSAIKDVASKEIIGWEVSPGLSMNFVLDSLNNLKNNNILKNETIIHSDQGFHYTNPEYIKKVKDLNLIQSMSRKGNCLDNSPIESFFGHLKDELDLKTVNTFNELREVVSKYMEYYNGERYQWEIKKMTPIQYRNHLLSKA